MTISGLDMTATVPGPGDRLAARISELPSSHDGEEQFTARLDFNRSPNLEWKNVRDHVVVVTGGDVNRSPRVVKGDNAAWTLMITPDGDGTVGIAVPITGSCGNQADVCDGDGTMLAHGAWRMVRGPGGDTLTRPQNTVREVETQPTIRPEEPEQTEPGPGGASEVTGQNITACTYTVLPGETSYTYNLNCDGQLTQFNAYLNHASKTHSYTNHRVGRKLPSGSWNQNAHVTLSAVGASSISLPFSGTAVTYNVCIGPSGVNLRDNVCNNDSSGQSSGTRGETRTITLNPWPGCEYDLQPTATSFTYNLDCDGQLTQFNAYLNHPSKTHSFTKHRLAHRTTGSTGWQTSSATSNASSISLPFSGTGISYEVCIYPEDFEGFDTIVTDTICYADSSGQTGGTRSETRVITLSAPLTLSAPGNFTFVNDVPISSETLPQARGGFGDYSYEIVGALPTGLSFNGTTRILSGTPRPDNPTTTQHTYKVTDGEGNSVSATPSFSITVEELVLPSPGALSFQLDAFGSETLPEPTPAGVSVGLYQVYGVPNTVMLPAGLSFNPTTRTISGTPTALQGPTTYEYAATLSTTSRQVRFTIAVIQTINVPAVSDIYATVGQPINVTLPAVTDTTATTPITYNLMGAPYDWGADWPDGPANAPGLPAALSFNPSTRVLSGTPTFTVGGRRLAYTAVDANGARGLAEFELRIREPLKLAQPDDITVADGEAMVPVYLPRAQDGHSTYPDGYTYYDYSVSGLPFGLRYHPHRHYIYGTPRYSRPPREVEVTLSVTDKAGTTLERTFTIEMLACSVTVDPIDDRTYQAGTEIDPVVLPAARGACGDVSYALNGLPDGLEFDPETRTLSGTPADFDGNERDYLHHVEYVATDEQGSKTVEFTIVLPTADSVCGPNRDAGPRLERRLRQRPSPARSAPRRVVQASDSQ